MTFKDFVVRWSNTWLYDYWWRQKYKVSFNSEQHRAANPIDVKFEYLEEKIVNKHYEDYKDKEEREKEFKAGIWIRENVNKEEEDRLFDQIDLSKL